MPDNTDEILAAAIGLGLIVIMLSALAGFAIDRRDTFGRPIGRGRSPQVSGEDRTATPSRLGSPGLYWRAGRLRGQAGGEWRQR